MLSYEALSTEYLQEVAFYVSYGYRFLFMASTTEERSINGFRTKTHPHNPNNLVS